MPAPGTALWHHFDDLDHQRSANMLGMWAFLATEVMVFGAAFTGYVVYRSQFLPSFEEASRHLNLLIGGVNTVVLLTSSLTMALAVRDAQLGRQRPLVWMLILTALLGTAFMVLKGVEYTLDYYENLVPRLAFKPQEWQGPGVYPEQVKMFLFFYYALTGLHAVHLTIGIGILLALAILARRGAFTTGNFAPVEMWGLYWHFVDIVWIFLLPLLYLVGTRAHWY